MLEPRPRKCSSWTGSSESGRGVARWGGEPREEVKRILTDDPTQDRESGARGSFTEESAPHFKVSGAQTITPPPARRMQTAVWTSLLRPLSDVITSAAAASLSFCVTLHPTRNPSILDMCYIANYSDVGLMT